MLSWPTGGGHGRSLITLISTAFVFPPKSPAGEEMEEGGGKRKADARGCSGKAEMSGSREQEKENRRERVSETPRQWTPEY